MGQNVMFRPSVRIRKDTKFYFMLRRYDEEKRFLFYTGMEGKDEKMSKCIVKYFLKNVKTGDMDCVTVSGVVPVDIMADVVKVIETGSYGSVSDKMMERSTVVIKMGTSSLSRRLK